MLASSHMGLESVLVAADNVTQLTVVVTRFALLRDALLLLQTLLVVLTLQVSLVGLDTCT